MAAASSEFEHRLSEIRYGDHVCLIYENQAEQLAAAVPFISHGLATNDCCIYIADERTVHEVCAALEQRGIDVRAEQQRGALQILTKRDSYLKQGAFDPAEMLDSLSKATEVAVRDGFSGFRVTGEMAWALGPEIGCDRLIEYEILVNRFYPGSRAVAICQYNRQRFSPGIIRDVLRTHPLAVIGNHVCTNLYYEPPEIVQTGGCDDERIDWMLSQLRRNEQAFEDLKRTQSALRHSELRYRAMVEATPECVKIMAADGTLLQMNPAGIGMVEAEEPPLGKCVYDVVVEEDRERFRQFNEQVCQGQPGTLEFDIIGLKGTRRHMESTAVPLEMEDGSVAHLAITRDVTRQHVDALDRDAQHAMAERERKRLQEIFQLAPSFMAVLRGPEHVIERVNERYQQLVGQRELIGRKVREAFPEVKDQGFLETLDSVYRTGKPYVASNARVLLQRSEGPLEEVILEFVHQPLRDSDGVVSGILVQGIDQTERSRAEIDLARVTATSERRERLYETILSTTPDLIYVFDLQYRFTYVNNALLQMWGKTWDESIGRTCLELGYEPWHAEMHNREIDQVVATRMPIRGEVPFTGTHGRRIYDYIFVPVFNAEGHVEAIAGTTRDVTERRRMADELRESDRKKDDFLAVLAHELRNPLAPLRNGLQVLRLAGNDMLAVSRARSMMERQLAHMVRLIDDLLDISRISRNKLELRRSRVLLSDIIETAVETARPQIEEAGHSLSVSLPAIPVFLNADLTRLAQVFSNLLTNSAKYTPAGGTIELNAVCTTREGLVQDVIVEVRDNGIGIPAASQSSIFDMFSQVEQPPGSARSGGLGIGLALVKGLVEMHGGSVGCDSAGPGMGSTFSVRLPVEEIPAGATGSSAGDGRPALSKRRILVVDDNRDGAESLAMMLRLLENEVHTAHDGLQAVQQAEQLLPELILMDIGMPVMNGLDATRRIRQQPWGAGILIIALTGWGQDVDRLRSREAGCDSHLVKPVDLTELQQLIEDLAPANRRDGNR